MAEKHMIVQFGSPSCKKCKEFQKEYEKVARILIGEGIGVYRVDDATLSRQYGIPRLPTLIYFRSEGLPVMYFGGLDGYEIAEWMDSNGEQITVNLYDGDFEHLTQASTGATTGNWMVNFCKPDVPGCSQLTPSWEGAAARLKGRANFAYVDPTKNELLKKRFNIGNSLPVIMLFRLGKQYVYELPARDPASLAVFAETGYQHAKGSPVSIQQSPFDSLVERLAHILKEFSSDKDKATLYICAGALLLMAFMALALIIECCRIIAGDPKNKKSEEKKTE
ncbi:protein disulfide-isomerase A6 homolog isoform X2 [Anneissia japonica]|nr:protein disulfide-isomerase A6 homolog isoform X2 [Anneissia japonica]